MSPPPASDAEATTGGSSSAPAAGANVSGDERVEAIPSLARQREGKAPAIKMTVSDVTLTAPHFIPADFATRPEITPFMDGVCQVRQPWTLHRAERIRRKLRGRGELVRAGMIFLSAEFSPFAYVTP